MHHSHSSSPPSFNKRKSTTLTPFKKLSPKAVVTTAAKNNQTPPGSSKLLRQHFASLSVQTSRRRRLDSGAVRLISPARSVRKRIGFSSPLSARKTMSSPRDVEDATSLTDQSFDSCSGIVLGSLTQPLTRTPRMDCMDPVALTLLKGEEDSLWLFEQDEQSPPPEMCPKVSANFQDIYGTAAPQELARPVPIVARRRPFY